MILVGEYVHKEMESNWKMLVHDKKTFQTTHSKGNENPLIPWNTI